MSKLYQQLMSLVQKGYNLAKSQRRKDITATIQHFAT